MWAALNLVYGLAVQPAPFALKLLLQDFSAAAQSSAKSAAAEVPLRAAGGTVDGGLLRVERTGAIGANGAAAPRSEQDAAMTDQQLLSVTAPRDVHVGDSTTAAAALTTTCCGPERGKSLVPVADASEPDYLEGEYPDDYGWGAAGLTADPGTFAAYREAALIHARRAELGIPGSLTPGLVAKCTAVQVDEPAWLEPDAQVFPGGDLEMALADDPDTVTELQLREVKNGRLAGTSMFGHYVRAAATDGPVASWTTHVALATLYVYLILADDPDTVTELQLHAVKNGRLARASMFGHYVQAITTSMQIDAPVCFKAGVQNFPEDGLDYINGSNLVRARSSRTRATCQSVLMGAFKAQASPETPVWHHCLSYPQCAVYFYHDHVALATLCVCQEKATVPNATVAALQDSADFAVQLHGILPPAGFVDPAGLYRMQHLNKLAYAHDAELQRGRHTVLAALGFTLAGAFHPVFPGGVAPPNISSEKQLQSHAATPRHMQAGTTTPARRHGYAQEWPVQ